MVHPYSGLCCSIVRSCLNLCNPMKCKRQASLPFTISLSLLKPLSIESGVSPKHLIPFSFCLNCPSITVFFTESALGIWWPKYWRFSFNISPSNEYSGLIFLRIDWFDLLAVQGTLKTLPSPSVRKHQFFGIKLALWSSSHIHTWLLEKP